MIRLAHKRVSLIATAALVAVPLLTAATLAPADSAIGPPCHSSFNPYAYSRAAVAACGYTTFGLSEVKGIEGGGRRYIYDENGTKAEIMVPPAGFDPVTATSAQLAEYGFPPRPAGSAERASWDAEMSHVHSAPAPPFLAETHARAYNNVSSENWSGYVATGSIDEFTHAEAYYYEPSYYPSSCSPTSALDWAGIGGYDKASPLGQDGTAYGVSGMAAHQAWWELYPTNSIQPVNLSATVGYIFYASVQWVKSAHGSYYSFFLKNTRSGASVSLRYGTSSYDGTSAEVITERPTNPKGSLTNLSNYKTMTYHQTYANGSGLNTFSHLHNLTMVDSSGTTMAIAGNIESDGNFKDYQHLCH